MAKPYSVRIFHIICISYSKNVFFTRGFFTNLDFLQWKSFINLYIMGVRKEAGTLHIDLSTKEFRRLLDLVYIGNWILNSTRGDDRIKDYDDVESKLFALCRTNGMDSLVERWEGEDVPSRAFSDGGIHEAIMDYEDSVFFDILAEELARRDMEYEEISDTNYEELLSRMDDYIEEFEANGTDNLQIETEP